VALNLYVIFYFNVKKPYPVITNIKKILLFFTENLFIIKNSLIFLNLYLDIKKLMLIYLEYVLLKLISLYSDDLILLINKFI